MRDTEIHLPTGVTCQRVEQVIDEAIAQRGLQVTLRGSLKKYPGSIHWHLKNGRASGTLEITLWPERQRAWFTIQDGRVAPWLDGEIERLAELIRQRLGGG
ncbi:MAG: hypothetical protein WD872_05490 [Pirellulaceae bacterium]